MSTVFILSRPNCSTLIILIKRLWVKLISDKLSASEKDDIEEPMSREKLKGGQKCCRW
jgi:hypothetical protein